MPYLNVFKVEIKEIADYFCSNVITFEHSAQAWSENQIEKLINITNLSQAFFKLYNQVQLMAYFEIYRRIILFEPAGKKRAEYGKKALSDKLAREFGREFSRSNIEYMRKFYTLYDPGIS